MRAAFTQGLLARVALPVEVSIIVAEKASPAQRLAANVTFTGICETIGA